MNKPLLSICIPTFNRSAYLKNSLNSIIGQKEFQKGYVEIVVSDNASTDDTQVIVKEYMSRYENIKYFKNIENVRDQNFALSLRRGKGLYRKLSNDTFLFCPGSLKYICNLIRKYEKTREVLCFLDGKGKDLKKDIVKCTDFDQFVRTVNNLAYWTGPFGLWDNECEEITKDFSGCELMLWQCQKLYNMMIFKRKAVFINKRLFFVQEVSGKDMSYGLYQVLHLNFLSILNYYVSEDQLSQETYEKIRIENLYSFTSFLTRGKHKKEWDFQDRDYARESIFNEVKKLGLWQDYYKYYKMNKFIYPLRTTLKITFLQIYCAILSFHTKLEWKRLQLR